MANQEPEPITIYITRKLDELIELVNNGHRIWGGGAGVHRHKMGAFPGMARHLRDTFVLTKPAPEGGDGSEFFTTARDAIWAYLRHLGGNATINITLVDP